MMPQHEPSRRLKPVSELYGRHPGSDIYVVGTGPSLRVFPLDFLRDRITIGLNMAWKLVPVDYGITVHPHVHVPEFLEGGESRPEITWATKHEKLGLLSPPQIAHAEERFHFFRTDGRRNTSRNGQSNAGQCPEWLLRPTGEFLYLVSSISQPAVNLAANMGARNIVLVGCDNASLFGNHHADDQPTAWLGASADQRYRDYYTGLAEVRAVLRQRGVNVVSVNPFLTLGPHEDEFLRLCHELGRAELIPNVNWHRTRRDRAMITARRRLRTARRWVQRVRPGAHP